DIDERAFEATKKAIQQQRGSADAFYQSPKYLANKNQYLNQEDFTETLRLQKERERKLGRGETRLEELTVGSAVRKGAKGEEATLAIDFAEAEKYGLALGTATGANMIGADKGKAAAALSQKYHDQQEEAEIDKRQKAMQEEADREYEREREQAALRGELGTVTRREVARDEAAAAVQADAVFQQNLTQESATLRSSLENAKSINLINKGRVGRSAQQIYRHEQAHNAVSAMDAKELDTFWQQLAPERQKEIQAFIRSNWANGNKMSMRQIQDEFFTEVFASHGRSKRLGPLGLNMEDPEKYQETKRVIDEEFEGKADAFYKSKKYRDNTMDYVQRDNMQRAVAEEALAERLSGASTLNKQEKAHQSVRTISPEGTRSLWETFSPARQQEIEDYITSDSDQLRFLKSGKNRERYDNTRRLIKEKYDGNTRAFFESNTFRENRSSFLKEKDFRRGEQELLAAQHEALGSMLASFNGAETDGPLNFQKHEQDLALLIRAATDGKRPQTMPTTRSQKRPAAAVSAGEYGGRPTGPSTVAAPAGSQRVIVSPPSRIVERRSQAPISPVVQTNIIQNTTVRSVADELTRKIQGRVDMLPTRQDLLSSLQQLQNVVLQVAREQGVAHHDVVGLSAELDQLKAEVRSPSRRPEDEKALKANIASFMNRFTKTQSDKEEEETPESDAA
ncbi:MAG: hypothetical protein V1778_03170, partial [bacterium]